MSVYKELETTKAKPIIKKSSPAQEKIELKSDATVLSVGRKDGQ